MAIVFLLYSTLEAPLAMRWLLLDILPIPTALALGCRWHYDTEFRIIRWRYGKDFRITSESFLVVPPLHATAYYSDRCQIVL